MPEIKGVEIFGEGIWNGNKITSDVLKNIVEGFKATKSFIKPYLKLGHDEDQKLLQKDGYPAAGWVSNVYIQGKKLFADFTDIPEKIYELIKKKAYRKVSVEIFSGYSFDDKMYPNLLGAVALLGADTPAVLSLNDILSQYKIDPQNFAQKKESDNIEVKVYTTDVEGDMSDQNKTDEDVLSKLDTYSKQLEDSQKANDSLKSEFEQFKKDSETKISDLLNEKTKTEIENYTLSLKGKKLLSPSMEPYVKALFSKGKQEFSVADKKMTSFELVEKVLELAKEVYAVNFDEKTDIANTSVDQGMHAKIEAYAKENKIDYADAYKHVMKQK